MAVGRNTTPLIALDAVVLDTETTGLDPRKARIVEIAAVRLVGGRLDTSSPFRRLVQPGEPIPASTVSMKRPSRERPPLPASGRNSPPILALRF